MGSRRDLPSRGDRPRTSRFLPTRWLFVAFGSLLTLFGASVAPAFAGMRADVDRDGRLDVVGFERSPDRITVALAGSTRAQVLPSIDRLDTVALSDIDGDGDLDIVGSSDRYGILLWRNTGRGRFIATRPVLSAIVVRANGPAVDRARAADSSPDSAYSEQDRDAIVGKALELFQASCAPVCASPGAGTRSAASVFRSSRAPPGSLFN